MAETNYFGTSKPKNQSTQPKANISTPSGPSYSAPPSSGGGNTNIFGVPKPPQSTQQQANISTPSGPSYSAPPSSGGVITDASGRAVSRGGGISRPKNVFGVEQAPQSTQQQANISKTSNGVRRIDGVDKTGEFKPQKVATGEVRPLTKEESKKFKESQYLTEPVLDPLKSGFLLLPYDYGYSPAQSFFYTTGAVGGIALATAEAPAKAVVGTASKVEAAYSATKAATFLRKTFTGNILSAAPIVATRSAIASAIGLGVIETRRPKNEPIEQVLKGDVREGLISTYYEGLKPQSPLQKGKIVEEKGTIEQGVFSGTKKTIQQTTEYKAPAFSPKAMAADIPILNLFVGERAKARQAVREELKGMGFKGQALAEGIESIEQQARKRSAVEGAALIYSSAGTEGVGRAGQSALKLFTSKAYTKPQAFFRSAARVAATNIPLGFIEGSVQEVTSQKLRGQPTDIKEAAKMGGYGAASATLFGVGITSTAAVGRKTTSKAIEGAAIILDPSEPLGDITRNVEEGFLRSQIKRDVPTPQIFTTGQRVAFNRGVLTTTTSKQTTAAQARETTRVPTQIPQPIITPSTTLEEILTPVTQKTTQKTPSETILPTLTQSTTSINQFTKTEIPEIIPTITETQTETTTIVPTITTITTPVVTPQPRLPFPILPAIPLNVGGGGVGFGSRSTSKFLNELAYGRAVLKENLGIPTLGQRTKKRKVKEKNIFKARLKVGDVNARLNRIARGLKP